MKAIELLKCIVESGMNCMQMGFVTTPDVKSYPPSWTREEIWFEWFKEVFWSDEVCILSEDKEVMYAYANDHIEQRILNELNGNWITNRDGDRIYLFELE